MLVMQPIRILLLQDYFEIEESYASIDPPRRRFERINSGIAERKVNAGSEAIIFNFCQKLE
jgi:hypothetical protein